MKKTAIAILAISLVFALTACKEDDPPPKDTPCTCATTYGTTAHLGIDEDCDCGGTGCGCTEQIGYAGTIPVHKVIGISVGDMNSAVTALDASYADAVADLGGVRRLGEITAIHLTNGVKISYGTDNILSIKLDFVNDAVDESIHIFYLIGNGTIEPDYTYDE